MLSRLAALSALVMVACAAAVAQEGPPARRDDPPRQEPLPPRIDSPPPRIESGPPRIDSGPPRIETPPPRAEASGSRCGAVAYTADGAFGAAYGMEDCSDAERLAIDECRRESTDKDDCAQGVVTRRDAWFHIQFCREGNDWTTHITSKPTLAETNRDANDWAQKSKYGANNCRLVPNGLLHSGGLHTKM